MKTLSALPLGLAAGSASGAAGLTSPSGSETAPAFGAEIFRSIGVEPVINCRGTFTIIGGSLERPEVRAAMEAASTSFVQYDELAEGIGRRLAELTGAEWGMVSAGCAAALKHATAACVAGGNPEKLLRIPDLTGFDKTQVIIPRHSRNAYDHAIRNIGVEVITVETPEELQRALSPRTAMIYLLAGRTGPMGLKAIAEMARPLQIPILVDAAAENLTIPNVHLQEGATMVAYSGGKALRGPQCAGLLLGPKDLLTSAWQASSPHHGPGRDNKVGREEMIGMLAAVEAWVKIDHEAEWKTWLSYLDTIAKRVSTLEGVTTAVREPSGLSNYSPRLDIMWDPAKLHITGEELAEIVGRTKPRIALGSGHDNETGTTSVNITAWMMQPGEDKIVADRLYELLSQKRSPRSTAMSAPAATLTGRWNVDIEFSSSRSRHTWYIEQQDQNWIEGSHKGDFSVRDVAGTIEGNQVKLLSVDRRPGDSVTFIFTGNLSSDANTISGQIFLGEYLSARFTANRQSYTRERRPIMVPGGPPLAT